MLAIAKTVRTSPPRAPYKEIKRHILGSSFELSLVFVGDAYMRRLNTQYRKKNRTTNVLAFPLSKTEGEIFINLSRAYKEAHGLGMSAKKYTAYLFAHACLHLKGYKHGEHMEAQEHAILKKYT